MNEKLQIQNQRPAFFGVFDLKIVLIIFFKLLSFSMIYHDFPSFDENSDKVTSFLAKW